MANKNVKLLFFWKQGTILLTTAYTPKNQEITFSQDQFAHELPLLRSLNCHCFGPKPTQQDDKLQNQGWLRAFEFKEQIFGHKNAKRHYKGTKMAYLGLPRIKNCMQ